MSEVMNALVILLDFLVKAFFLIPIFSMGLYLALHIFADVMDSFSRVTVEIEPRKQKPKHDYKDVNDQNTEVEYTELLGIGDDGEMIFDDK